MKQYAILAKGYADLINFGPEEIRNFDESKTYQENIMAIVDELKLELGLQGYKLVDADCMSHVPEGAVAKIYKNWRYGVTYVVAVNAAEKIDVKKGAEVPEPKCAYEGLTESERRKNEKQWDALYNEGGEGHNPYRLPDIYPVIESQDY